MSGAVPLTFAAALSALLTASLALMMRFMAPGLLSLSSSSIMVSSTLGVIMSRSVSTPSRSSPPLMKASKLSGASGAGIPMRC